jgi:hypothetical protein
MCGAKTEQTRLHVVYTDGGIEFLNRFHNVAAARRDIKQDNICG